MLAEADDDDKSESLTDPGSCDESGGSESGSSTAGKGSSSDEERSPIHAIGSLHGYTVYTAAWWTWVLRPVVVLSCLWPAAFHVLAYTRSEPLSHDPLYVCLKVLWAVPICVTAVCWRSLVIDAGHAFEVVGVLVLLLGIYIDLAYTGLDGQGGFVVSFTLLELVPGKRVALGIAFAVWVLMFVVLIFVYVRVVSCLSLCLPVSLTALPPLIGQLYLALGGMVWDCVWQRYRHDAPRGLYAPPLVVGVLTSELCYMCSFLSYEAEWTHPRFGHRVFLLSMTNFMANMVARTKLLKIVVGACRGRDVELNSRIDVELRCRWSVRYAHLPATACVMISYNIVPVGHQWNIGACICLLGSYYASELITDLALLLYQQDLRRRQLGRCSLLETWRHLQRPGGHLFPVLFGTTACHPAQPPPAAEAGEWVKQTMCGLSIDTLYGVALTSGTSMFLAMYFAGAFMLGCREWEMAGRIDDMVEKIWSGWPVNATAEGLLH